MPPSPPAPGASSGKCCLPRAFLLRTSSDDTGRESCAFSGEARLRTSGTRGTSGGSRSAIDASFRDPSGFVFEEAGVIYRQVNQQYAENYERLMTSGLYEELTTAGLLIRHREAAVAAPDPAPGHKG